MSIGRIDSSHNMSIDCIVQLPRELLYRIIDECMDSLKKLAPVCKTFHAAVREVSGRNRVEAMTARVFSVKESSLSGFCRFKEESLVYITKEKVKKIDFRNSEMVEFRAKVSSAMFIDHLPHLGFHFRNDSGHHYKKQLIDFTHKKLGQTFDGETSWESQSDVFVLNGSPHQFTLKKGSLSETYPLPNLAHYSILLINDTHILLKAREIVFVINRKSRSELTICEEYWFVYETDHSYIAGRSHGIGNMKWDVLDKDTFEKIYSFVDHRTQFASSFDLKKAGNLVFYTLRDDRLAFTNVKEHYSCILPTRLKRTCNFQFSYPLVAFKDQSTNAFEIWNASARICLFSKNIFNNFRLCSFGNDHIVYYEAPNRIKILSSSHLTSPPGIEAKYETFWDRLLDFVLRIFKAIKEWFKEIRF